MAHGGEHDSRLRRRAPEKTNGMNPLVQNRHELEICRKCLWKKLKPPGISSQIRQALQSFLIFLHQFSAFSCFQTFPSYPLARFTSAILGIELPIALLARETPPR